MFRQRIRSTFTVLFIVGLAMTAGCAPFKSGTYYTPVDAGEKGFMRTPKNSISRPIGQGARMEFGVRPADPDADEPSGADFWFKVIVPEDTLVQFGSRTFRIKDEDTLDEFTFDAQFIDMHQIVETPDEEEEVGHETWEIDFMDRLKGATYKHNARILPDTILHNFFQLEFSIDNLRAQRFSVYFPVAQVNHTSVDLLPVQFILAESKWYMGEIVP